MSFPEDLKYTKTHEWVKLEGDVCTIGVTEFAQKELSDVVYVELPDIDRELAAGDAACVVESVKAAFDIYAPVSGTVTEVNDALEDDPALVNTACYTDGWFMKVSLSKKDEISSLMDVVAYTKHVEEGAH